ncbi:MAG TPA: flagellar basal-body MS-ring/collar protein FliF [Mycobacteriales bacterium]|nr:flagellar basal-body MS-ring/collar protein FliF [Mycobacteriales bacterium]
MPVDAIKARLSGLRQTFSTAQLVIIGVLAVIGVVGTYALLRWVGQTPYDVLYSGLSSKDASAVTQKLSADGVAYKLSGDGSTISVPRNKVAAEHVSVGAAGIVTGGNASWGIIDKESLTTSSFQQQVDYQQALEGELASALESMSGISNAKIDLVLPQQQLFASDQQPATASVLLTTDSSFTSSQVPAVVNLVASGVQNLAPEDVTVTDTNGDLLTGPNGTAGGGANSGQQYGDQLAARAQAMLDTMLGPGKAYVQVAATVDHSTHTLDKTTYNKSSAVPLAQSKTTQTYTGPGAASAAGALSTTTTTGSTGSTSTNNTYKQNNVNSQYGVDTTNEKTEIPAGQITNLSVAVAVDSTAKNLPPVTSIQQLVSAAVGLQPSRGDTIAVTPTPFATAAATPAPKAGLMSNSLIPTGVGIALLLLVAFMLSRALRRTTFVDLAIPGDNELLAGGSPQALPPMPTQRALASGPDGRPSVLASAESEPDEVARLLHGWMNEHGDASTTSAGVS